MAVFSNKATLKYSGKTVASNTVYGNMPGYVRMTKRHIEAAYTAGGTLTYLINIINSSGADSGGLTLADDLGAYDICGSTVVPLEYISGTLSLYINGILQATPMISSSDGLTVSGFSLPDGAAATVIYQAKVAVMTQAAITNTATLSGSGVPDGFSASDTAARAISCAARPLTYSVTDLPYKNENR